jgi:GDP-mannose pyrophosphatase NudK
MKINKALWILVAGPYRSGTNDNPELIEANVKAMNEMALKVLHKGHMPILGEWIALPLIKEAGSETIGDAIFNEIFHPIAIRLQDKLDAVLRIGGASQGADEMVNQAHRKGLEVYYSLDEIPELITAS